MRQTVLALLIFGLLTAAPASAANPARPGLPKDLDGTVTTTNVMVHYRTSETDEAAARSVADAVEKSLTRYAALGFPRPKDDGDGLIDIYYFITGSEDKHGSAGGDDSSAPTTSGYIRLNRAYDGALETVKHELFHLVQFTIGRGRAGWFSEGTASWARWQVDDPPAKNFQYMTDPDYQFPLDCVEGSGGPCAGFSGGYTGWLFFSRLDAQLIHDTLIGIDQLYRADQQRHGMDALVQEMTERGLTLEGVLVDLATRMVQGTLGYPNSASQLPTTDLAVKPPASGTASKASTDVVHHASLGFTEIVPAAGRCATVPLAIELDGPEGVAAASFVQRGGAVEPLTNGSTTVPWIACKDEPAMIAIANGTLDADDQSFTVSGRVITPSLSGLQVAATTTRQAGRGFKLPVKVRSSAAGALQAKLAGAASQRVVLKPGANAFTLQVPKSFKAKKAVLALTPSIGAYQGRSLQKRLKFTTKR